MEYSKGPPDEQERELQEVPDPQEARGLQKNPEGQEGEGNPENQKNTEGQEGGRNPELQEGKGKMQKISERQEERDVQKAPGGQEEEGLREYPGTQERGAKQSIPPMHQEEKEEGSQRNPEGQEAMKSPFKKLRDLAVSKHNKMNEPSSLAEELFEPEDVMQDMENVESIRTQYEGLLTNAHVISGSAYDFSRSVQDMASHMLEAFGQYLDGEIGHVFSMLAKVQFELSKLLDIFATHVSQTIITPTEKMMGEIQQVQVMKEQYDEKRSVLDY
ncbi:hypothetical protein L7F22_055756 [Adiantum nelumboides]|nr:hypothetical protein [Adiantum nelumboides]